ncbi:MAG: dTMP kinase [Verrucomicrobiota bacterium]
MKPTSKGFFITFEGPEGAGKTTQAQLLVGALEEAGWDVILLREPGGCPLAEELRGLLKHFGQPGDVCAEAELLMFGAARAQLMRQIILPHLSRGGIVVCDRFADSTTVYQGMARKLAAQFIENLHEFVIENRWPDLTFLLDLTVEETLARTGRRQTKTDLPDRMENEDRDFYQAVRNGFLRLARAEPNRFRIVEAKQPVEEIHQRIIKEALCALDPS